MFRNISYLLKLSFSGALVINTLFVDCL